MIEFSSFSKKYGNRVVLNLGAKVELTKGLLWLKGKNGAGKSTLMKCAAGMIPFKGDITLVKEGFSLKKEPIKYRKCVSISEAEPVFPAFLKGTEIIDFFVKAKQGTDAQASGLIELLQAHSFIHERMGTYSSGMNKKLSLVLAFIGTPSVILLDEPLITLDQPAQDSVCDLIVKKYNEGSNFLISSHQQLELPTAAILQHVMLIGGKLVTSVND